MANRMIYSTVKKIINISFLVIVYSCSSYKNNSTLSSSEFINQFDPRLETPEFDWNDFSSCSNRFKESKDKGRSLGILMSQGHPAPESRNSAILYYQMRIRSFQVKNDCIDQLYSFNKKTKKYEFIPNLNYPRTIEFLDKFVESHLTLLNAIKSQRL